LLLLHLPIIGQINFCIKEWESGVHTKTTFESTEARIHWQSQKVDLRRVEEAFGENNMLERIRTRLVTKGR
jgi:hypothetical protein